MCVSLCVFPKLQQKLCLTYGVFHFVFRSASLTPRGGWMWAFSWSSSRSKSSTGFTTWENSCLHKAQWSRKNQQKISLCSFDAPQHTFSKSLESNKTCYSLIWCFDGDGGECFLKTALHSFVSFAACEIFAIHSRKSSPGTVAGLSWSEEQMW